MRLLYHSLTDHCAVLKHILQIHKVAVMHMLRIVVSIMEVNDPFLIGIDNLLREQKTCRDITAYLSCHVVTLHAVDYRVLVGVLLLDLLIIAFNEAEDPVICCICLSHQRPLVTVSYIAFSYLECTVCHDLVLDHILNLFNRDRPSEFLASVFNIISCFLYLGRRKLMCDIRIICLCYSSYDLIYIEINL